MKRTIFVLLTLLVVFVGVFSVLVLRPVAKVKATNGCTKATLKGTYGLVGSGFSGSDPASLSMVVTFNGMGGASGSNLYTVVGGYQIADNATFSNGTYTIASNCSFVVTMPDLLGATDVYAYGTAVDTGGDEVTGQLLSTLNNLTGTFDAKRVAVGLWSIFR